ncbi:hypothetical protein C1H46_023542 [Malus baccata]|uniref:Transmembrane protein n=1 Tax=Malus baccata TaxID=106549 RepID=A0A540LX88_MALBA|nr:hypothetical protein C1H46_023542 [Malus baccata]
MVHKACVVCMILFIALLLLSSKTDFANVSDDPIHKKVTTSRRYLQIKISVANKISVPVQNKAPGVGH